MVFFAFSWEEDRAFRESRSSLRAYCSTHELAPDDRSLRIHILVRSGISVRHYLDLRSCKLSDSAWSSTHEHTEAAFRILRRSTVSPCFHHISVTDASAMAGVGQIVEAIMTPSVTAKVTAPPDMIVSMICSSSIGSPVSGSRYS